MFDRSGLSRRLIFSFAAFMTTVMGAHAADVEFPPGSHVGLVPPPGMTASRNFFGFEDATNQVAMIFVTLPREAFAEIDRTMTVDALQRQGVAVVTRESLSLDLGKALLLSTRQEANGVKLRKWLLAVSTSEFTALVNVQMPEAASKDYTDDKIRAAFKTVAVRQTVPPDEQLSLLPFRIGERAGFQVAGIMAGRAVMLSDEATDPPSVRTHIVVSIANGGPAQAADRGEFARQVFGTIPNIKDVRFLSSEPLRMGGQQGHQIMAQGKEAATGTDITIVQWLRFGSGAYMHMVGIARTDSWTVAYGRFRQVRDGVDAR